VTRHEEVRAVMIASPNRPSPLSEREGQHLRRAVRSPGRESRNFRRKRSNKIGRGRVPEPRPQPCPRRRRLSSTASAGLPGGFCLATLPNDKSVSRSEAKPTRGARASKPIMPARFTQGGEKYGNVLSSRQSVRIQVIFDQLLPNN